MIDRLEDSTAIMQLMGPGPERHIDGNQFKRREEQTSPVTGRPLVSELRQDR